MNKNLSPAYIFNLYDGKSDISSRIKLVCDALMQNPIDYYLINNPLSICWMLNIRGNDIDYNPIFLCYGLLDLKMQALTIFCEKPEYISALNEYDNINIKNETEMENALSGKNIGSSKEVSVYLWNNFITHKNHIKDPSSEFASIKTDKEIENSRKAHMHDAIAIIKFWHYLSELSMGTCSDEVYENQLVRKLHQIKKDVSKDYFSESFETILGVDENGAIIHYNPSRHDRQIDTSNVSILLDCGSHYKMKDSNGGATTDVTRVFLLSKPTARMKFHYTIVLKAHLQLLMSRFAIGTKMHQLNSIVVSQLYKYDQKCPHGIGHGVGSFLSVHEGPYGISQNCNLDLRKGLILSNEPGVYFEGHYGIRIENLILTKQDQINKDFISFENLTMVPYELELINKDLLTIDEINFIDNYHMSILKSIELNDKERDFLKSKLKWPFEYSRESFMKEFEQKHHYNVHYFSQIDSTNNWAIKNLSNLGDKAIVFASSQTAGRGKVNAKWLSENGGIYLTLLYSLGTNMNEKNLEKFQHFAIVTADSLMDVLRKNLHPKFEFMKENILVKWPNDLLINNKKCSGILPEICPLSDKHYLILGIGINFDNIINEEIFERVSTYIRLNIYELMRELVLDIDARLKEALQSLNVRPDVF